MRIAWVGVAITLSGWVAGHRVDDLQIVHEPSIFAVADLEQSAIQALVTAG
jgi:hypothetical protein